MVTEKKNPDGEDKAPEQPKPQTTESTDSSTKLAEAADRAHDEKKTDEVKKTEANGANGSKPEVPVTPEQLEKEPFELKDARRMLEQTGRAPASERAPSLDFAEKNVDKIKIQLGGTFRQMEFENPNLGQVTHRQNNDGTVETTIKKKAGQGTETTTLRYPPVDDKGLPVETKDNGPVLVDGRSKDGRSIKVMANGAVERELDPAKNNGVSKRLDYLANDSFGRENQLTFADRTETNYKDGGSRTEYKQPRADGLQSRVVGADGKTVATYEGRADGMTRVEKRGGEITATFDKSPDGITEKRWHYQDGKLVEQRTFEGGRKEITAGGVRPEIRPGGGDGTALPAEVAPVTDRVKPGVEPARRGRHRSPPADTGTPGGNGVRPAGRPATVADGAVPASELQNKPLETTALSTSAPALEIRPGGGDSTPMGDELAPGGGEIRPGAARHDVIGRHATLGKGVLNIGEGGVVTTQFPESAKKITVSFDPKNPSKGLQVTGEDLSDAEKAKIKEELERTGFNVSNDSGRTVTQMLDGRQTTKYEPARADGMQSETITPREVNGGIEKTERNYGTTGGAKWSESESRGADGRVQSREISFVNSKSEVVVQKQGKDGAVTTTVGNKPFVGASDAVLGVFTGANGEVRSLKANGELSVNYPETDNRKTETFYPAGNRDGVFRSIDYRDPAKNGGVAKETFGFKNADAGKNTVAEFSTTKDYVPPKNGEMQRIEFRIDQKGPVVRAEAVGKDGDVPFKRQEFKGPDGKGQVSHSQYEDGRISTKFSEGRVAETILSPDGTKKYLGRDGKELKDVKDDELVIKSDGNTKTYADGKTITTRDHAGKKITEVKYPENDPQQRKSSVDDQRKSMTTYKDNRTETSFKEGHVFDPAIDKVPDGIQPEDSRLLGANRITERPTDAKNPKRVEIEYDQEKLIEAAEGDDADLKIEPDLKKRTIITGDVKATASGDKVREEREYDGNGPGARIKERDVFQGDKPLYTEGEAKEGEAAVTYRKWQNPSGTDIEQRFNADGTISTKFGEHKGEDSDLSNKYSEITFDPETGEYTGKLRDDPDGEPVELEDDEIEKAVSQSGDNKSATAVLLNGDRVITGDGKPTITEFSPFDSEGRVSESKSGDTTETVFKDGRRQVEHLKPRPDGLKRETFFSSDDSQKRIAHREYEGKGDLKSETEFKGKGNDRLVERKFEGAGRTYEREHLDRDGNRLSVERDGQDEKGRFTEVERSGSSTRRWENGKFKVSNDKGEVNAEGTSRKFSEVGNEGVLDVDDKTGKTIGVRFTEGPRKGETWSFAHGEDGKASDVTVTRSGKDGAPETVHLSKGADGKWNPPDGKIPGLDHPADSAEFVVKANGEIVLDHKNGIIEKLRADGVKERYDMNDYSREVDGKKQHWDGYNWRDAANVSKVGDKTVIEFKAEGGKPTRVERDSKNDTLSVEFADKSRYDAKWKEQKLTHTDAAGKATSYFNTGERGTDSRPVWREGTVLRETAEGAIVDFKRGPNDKDLPKRVTINKNTGETTSVYDSGARISRDRHGVVERIGYPNGQQYKVNRDSAGGIASLSDANGTTYTRRGDDATNTDGTKVPRWEMERGGKSLGTFEGTISVHGANIEITGLKGDASSVESNGRTTNKKDGKVINIVDSQGQTWLPQGQADADGRQTWKVAGDDKGTFTGKLKLLDDGKVAVETSTDKVETRNSDGSRSRFNSNNIEVERAFDNGAQILRDNNGLITKTTDVNGVVREFSDYAQGQRGPVATKVKVTEPGKDPRFERVFEGQMRELKAGAKQDSTDPKDYGASVVYQDGTRIQFNEDKTIEETDLHGSKKLFSEKQELIRGVIRSANDNSITEIEGGKVKSTADSTGKLKREFIDYKDVPANPPGIPQPIHLPQQIKETRDGQETTLGFTGKLDPSGRPLYKAPDGSESAYDPRNQSLSKRLPDGTLEIALADGKKVIQDRSGPVSVSSGGQLNQIFEQGAVRSFSTAPDGKQTVSLLKAGPPPVETVTEESVETLWKGSKQKVLREVKDASLSPDDPKRFGGIVEYDPKTGGRKVYTEIDADGQPKAAVETMRDGSKNSYSYKDGKEFKDRVEFPDKSVLTMENNKPKLHKFEDGSSIQFNADGKPGLTTDVYGNQRQFAYKGDKVVSVSLKKAGEGEFKEVERVAGEAPADPKAEDRRPLRMLQPKPVEAGKPPEYIPAGPEVAYTFNNPPFGQRSEFQKIDPTGRPVAFKQERLDGTVSVLKEGQSSPEVTNAFKDKTKPAEVAVNPNSVRPEQSLKADAIVKEIIQAKGQVGSLAGQQLNELFKEAARGGNSEALRRYIESSMARQSSFRFDMKQQGEGEARTFSFSTASANRDLAVAKEITPGGGDAAVMSVDAPTGDFKLDTIYDGDLPSTYGDSEDLSVQRAAFDQNVGKLPEKLRERVARDADDFIASARERGLSDAEIARTIHNVNRLLEVNPADLTPPLDASDTIRTACDLVHDLANSDQVNKGSRQNCGLTSTFEQMLHSKPADTAQMAADSLLNGRFTAPDGRVVKLDPESMKAHRQARESINDRDKANRAGLQDQLGQVMTHALGNWALQKDYRTQTGKDADRPLYLFKEPSGQNKSGEVATVVNPVTKQVETYQNQASITLSMLAETNKTFLGRDNVFVNANVDKISTGTNRFKDQAEMTAKLAEELDNGPVTLTLDAGHPAFSRSGQTAREDWHAVTVTDTTTVDGETYFRVSDQRGASFDRWVSATDIAASSAGPPHGQKPAKAIYADRMVDGKPVLDGDGRPQLDQSKVAESILEKPVTPKVEAPQLPDIPIPPDDRSLGERARELLGTDKPIPGVYQGEVKPSDTKLWNIRADALIYLDSKSEQQRDLLMKSLIKEARGGSPVALESVRELSVLEARLQLQSAEKGRGKEADLVRDNALARLAELAPNVPSAKQALESWAKGDGTKLSGEALSELQEKRFALVNDAVTRAARFGPTIEAQKAELARREFLQHGDSPEGKARVNAMLAKMQAEEFQRLGGPSALLDETSKQLNGNPVAESLLDDIKKANGDLAFRINEKDIPRLRDELVKENNPEKLKVFDDGVERGRREKEKETLEVKQAQSDFLDRTATPEKRQEAITRLEKLLGTQAGSDKESLRSTIDFYKAADQMIKLKDAAGGHSVNSLVTMLGNPNTQDKAIFGLASIANGANGNKQEADAAKEALVKLSDGNPVVAKKSIDALLKTLNPPQSDAYGVLPLAAELAKRSNQFPEELRQALQNDLKSPVKEVRNAAFQSMASMADRWNDSDVMAVRDNMTADMAQAVGALRPDVLTAHKEILIPRAIEVMKANGIDPVKHFQDTLNITRDSLPKLEKPADNRPKDEAKIQALKQVRDTSIYALAEIARGRSNDPAQAQAAGAALLDFARPVDGADPLASAEKRYAVIDALTSLQPPRNDKFGTLETLGKVVALSSDVPQNARDALHKGLESKSPDVQRDALKGLKQFADKWTVEDVAKVKENLNFATIHELGGLPPGALDRKMPSGMTVKEELLDGVEADVQSDDQGKREKAVMMLAVLGGKEALENACLNVESKEVKDGEVTTRTELTVIDQAGTKYSFTEAADKKVGAHLDKLVREDGSSLTAKWAERVETVKPAQGATPAVTKSFPGDKLTTLEQLSARGILAPGGDITPDTMDALPAKDAADKPLTSTSDDIKATQTRDLLENVKRLAAGPPANKIAEDLLVTIGGVKEPAGDRGALLAANLGKVNGIIDQLKMKESPSRMAAVDAVNRAINPETGAIALESALNKMRIDQVMDGVGPQTTSEQLGKLQDSLNKQLEAAKLSGDRDAVVQLQDRLNWTSTARSLQDLNSLSTGADADKLGKSKAVIGELLQQAQRGNPHASTAVAMLLSQSAPETQARIQKLGADRGLPALPLPKLDHLSNDDRKLVESVATSVIAQKAAMSKGGISSQEALAVTEALVRAEASGDKRNSQLLSETIDQALKSKEVKINVAGIGELTIDGRKATVDALSQVLTKGERGSELLAGRYLANANTKELQRDLPAFVERARAGNETAIDVLAGMAAGADSDHAKQARAYMGELSAKPELREKAMLAAINARDAQTGDRKVAQELFKSMVGSGELPDSVRAKLHTMLGSTDAADRSVSAQAMVAIADQWTDSDLAAVKANIGSEMAQALKSLSPSAREEFAEELTDHMSTLLNDKALGQSKREAALEALAVVGGQDLIKNADRMKALGLVSETKDGITTLKDEKGTTYQFKPDAKGEPVLQRIDRTDKTSRINKFGERGQFAGAEEVIEGGNRLLRNPDNQITEVHKPNGDFIKVGIGADNKPKSVVDNQGHGWDSSDGGLSWTKRGTMDRAEGVPQLQGDGSVKFSSAKNQTEVVQRADGIVEKTDFRTKEKTIVKVDGSAVTTNDAGKIVRTRDTSGAERSFVWSQDNKQLVEVADNSGVWRSTNGLSWQRLDAPGTTTGARTVDESGYKISDAGKSETTFRLDGSRAVRHNDGSVDQFNSRGEQTSLRYNNGTLSQVTESGTNRIWKATEGGNFELYEGDKPSGIKAKIEVSPEGNVKRTIAPESRDAAEKLNIYADTSNNADGTAIARDGYGRARETTGRGGEKSVIEYDSDPNKVKAITTTLPNGSKEITQLTADGKYRKTFEGPNKNEANFWTIDALKVDHASGSVTMTGVKTSQRYGTGSTDRAFAQAKPLETKGAEHDSVVTSLTEPTKAFQKSGSDLRLTDVYRSDGARELINWGADGVAQADHQVLNRDGSIAQLDLHGKVSKVSNLPNGGSLEITRDSRGNPSLIRESNGTLWESTDGQVFRNATTGEALRGEFFAETDGRYGFKMSEGKAYERNAGRSETILTSPEKFGHQKLGDSSPAKLVIIDAGGMVEFDGKGQALAALTADGQKIVATRDGNGKLTQLRIEGKLPRIYTLSDSNSWNLNGAKIDGQVTFGADGSVTAFKDKPERPEFALKLDGTRIEKRPSLDLKKDGYRYVVENARGQISEFHFSTGGAADTLEIVKEGGRPRPDGSVEFTHKMVRMPNSRAQDGNSRWTILQHPDMPTKMEKGQTWIGTRDFEPASGATKMRGFQNGKSVMEISVTAADGWNYTPDVLGAAQSRIEASGAILWRDGNSQITRVDGAKGTKYDIARKGDMVSEVKITPPAAKEPSETLTSEDGKNWTRRFTENGQTKVEKFEGTVSVSPEGVITERQKNGSTRILRPEGSSVSFDAAANSASVTRPDGSTLRAGFGPDGKPNKIVKTDGSYSATNDGVTWSDYDRSGNRVGAERKETVNLNRSTGTLDITAIDGSRKEVIRADGTYSKEEKNAAGQMLSSESKNERGETTKSRYDKGEKLDTNITYADGTYRTYDRNNLLTEFKDVNGRVTKLEWQSVNGNTVVKNYTDEKGVKWNRQTENGRSFYQKEGGWNRRNESVFVNPEGNLERIYKVSSDLVGTNAGETEVVVREARGMDGRIVSTYDRNGGITVRNSEGLLSRSIRADGVVTQFGYQGTDKYGLPILRTVVEGEGPAAKTWSLSGDKEWRSGNEAQIAFWRVDQITGDMTYFNGDSLNRQRYSLENGWGQAWGGADLQGKANGIKEVKDNTWILNYSMPWQDSRFDDLNRRFAGLSGEEMQMMKYHLSAHKGIDIADYVQDKWGNTSYEGVTLHGHLAREGYTRTIDYAERADVTIRGAMAEMSSNSGRRRSEIQKDIRDKVGILNQEQLDTLNQISKANAPDGKSALERMKEHPSWKNAPEVHKAAMELYLNKGKEARGKEEEANLMKLALEYGSKFQGRGAYQPVLQRLELFKEFAGEGRASQASRDFFRAEMGGDALLEKALVRRGSIQHDADGKPGAYEYHNSMWKGNDDAGRVMTHAREFMKDGHLTAATMLEEGNWGSGTSTEEVKAIFDKMTPEQKVQVREGLDIRMALDGKFTNDAKIKAEALIAAQTPEGKKARESLEYFDKLNRTCSNLSIFADERRRVEYIARAAGASFTHEMGEGNVSTMWFRNADKQEHMKAVETIDRESFDLLSSDRALRSLNDQFMKDHFEGYERGRVASDLLKSKFTFADGLMGKSPQELRDILPGTKDLTQAQLDTLLQSRELDPKISAGQILQAQIDRGNLLTQQITNGEKVAAAIEKGERKLEGLPFNDKLAFDLFQTDRGEKLAAEIQAGTKTADKLSPIEKQALEQFNSVKDGELFKANKEALKQFNIALGEQLDRGRQLVEQAKVGEGIANDVAAGKRKVEDLNPQDRKAFDRFQTQLGEQLTTKIQSGTKKAADLSPLEKQAIDAYNRVKNTDAFKFDQAFVRNFNTAIGDPKDTTSPPSAGKRALDLFDSVKDTQEFKDSRVGLDAFKKFQEAGKLVQDIKDGQKLDRNIDEGRLINDSLKGLQGAARDAAIAKLPPEKQDQLARFREFESGKLSDYNKALLTQFQAWQRSEAKDLGSEFDRGKALADKIAAEPPDKRSGFRNSLPPEDRQALKTYEQI